MNQIGGGDGSYIRKHSHKCIKHAVMYKDEAGTYLRKRGGRRLSRKGILGAGFGGGDGRRAVGGVCGFGCGALSVRRYVGVLDRRKRIPGGTDDGRGEEALVE